MKKVLITLNVSLLGLAAFTACIADKGNYEYVDVNEVKIEGVAENYDVIMGSTVLHIDPKITASLASEGPDSDRYAYLWEIKNADGDYEVLSDTRVLDQVFDYAPATYEVYFRVHDLTADLRWKAMTKVTVGTPYTKGFMILGENASTGAVEFEMISMTGADTLVYGDILKKSGLPTLTKPLKVLHTGKSSSNGKVWVMTESGSYYLDLLTQQSNTANCFEYMRLIPNPFGKEEHVVDMFPKICANNGTTAYDSYRGYITNQGNIYFTWVGLMGDFYDYPHNCAINFTKPNCVFYKAAPYAMHYIKSSVSGMVWYDLDNERFMVDQSALSENSTVLTDKATDPYPWNNGQVNRTIVYGENTFNTDGGSSNGNSFAIMKDKTTNDGFIYKFYAKTTPEKRALYEVPASVAPGFTQAQSYAFSSKRTIVFYVIDGKLYAYDYNPGHEGVYNMSAFIGNDPVTMICFDTQAEPNSDYFYVATHSATQGGILRKFKIGANLNAVELEARPEFSYSGLCKIKHMSWRGCK